MIPTPRPARRSLRRPDACVWLHFDTSRLRREDLPPAPEARSVLTHLRRCEPACGRHTRLTRTDRTSPPSLVLGLGPPERYDDRALRAAAATLPRQLQSSRVRRLVVLAPPRAIEPFGPEGFARIFGEGLGLGAFEFSAFKHDNNQARGRRDVLEVDLGTAPLRKGLAEGLLNAESANYARALSATPPNVANPAYIAACARQLANRSSRLRCTVHRGPGLRREKLVGLENVGRASRNAPCLIELTWTPRKSARSTVVLIGKTITYDTGGLSLKINNGMKGMKYDKCGGMAVLGAMHAVSRIEPRCRVVALLPAAENSVSAASYRPDDILTYPNGVSVEVTNTDAEGRLVLADALAYACRKLKPDAIVDLATLTGGVVVALGRFAAGYWCEHEPLRKRLEAAAQRSGERIWRLPLWREYREMMKSKHADIWNSAPVRDAHPVQGAAFLSYFVDPKIPWAHIDIAGAATLDRDQMPFAAGPTGFGTRLLIELLRDWS